MRLTGHDRLVKGCGYNLIAIGIGMYPISDTYIGFILKESLPGRISAPTGGKYLIQIHQCAFIPCCQLTDHSIG